MLGQEAGQGRSESGRITRYDIVDNPVIGVAVIVDQPAPHTAHGRPRDGWKCSLGISRHAMSGLTDDFDATNQGQQFSSLASSSANDRSTRMKMAFRD